MTLQDHYAFRRQLTDYMARDLIGPSADDETITDEPMVKYVAGILFPKRSGSVPASEDNQQESSADSSSEDAPADPPVTLANVQYPSSVGLTFALDAAVDHFTVTVRAARYEPVTNGPVTGEGGAKRPWRRIPVTLLPITVDISRSEPGRTQDIGEGLALFVRVRRTDGDAVVPVTVVLVNTHVAPEKGPRDALCFFQTDLRVTAADGARGAFVERPRRGHGGDEDIRGYRLLYRHAREFAVGHGCAAHWSVQDDPERVSEIRTSFMPEFEVRLADAAVKRPIVSARMLVVDEGDRDVVLDDLEKLCEDYGDWIATCRLEADDLSGGDLSETAEQHMKACDAALQRMRNGIDVLKNDHNAWEAFRMANRAMRLQRLQALQKRGRPADEPEWRPFQLAFMLSCLEGLADARHPDRGIADLLWFPTGGGKTEAYLGLIAFTLFLRRLRNPHATGVTALMRYTLRLLTLQQFERAALLICACETIRRADSARLGSAGFSIGLWVGGGGTPNTLKDAEEKLQKLADGGTVEEGNPVQLHACPWCGTRLTHVHYTLPRRQGGKRKNPFPVGTRMRIACGEPTCDFADGLPAFLVDEDVYAERPSLLIATVDKYASLPWRPETAFLFNNPSDPHGPPPPELIIQDELHLISGPLGTLVGLYETAVDALCTRDGIGPKVIASTATIRRAADQGRGLFNRRVAQFPPPGIDARNSFFAVESDPGKRGTRMYAGLMAPGTSQTTLLVRVYAALLQGAHEIAAPDHVKDPYWTLVGYFNSLRVLGGARMQVQDDVEKRIAYLSGLSGLSPRDIEERIELTSRESSADIPQHLQRMATELGAEDERALDVVLATNMISVGVDIDRFGLMAVMGQPQSTSEYIQATSRVGRQHPGLVVVLFNTAKSRDRSHYESFLTYHSALYRHVESTSVTPFSSRARDRGLHAVLIALVRLLHPELRDEASASRATQYPDALQRAKRIILERVAAVTGSETDTRATEQHLDELIQDWMNDDLSGYRNKPKHEDGTHPLLIDAALEDSEEDGLATLWSMRDVDRESKLYLLQPQRTTT